MAPETPPKKKPPVNCDQPSAVCSLSASFLRPVSVSAGAVEGAPSLKEATPYMVRQTLRMETRPMAPRVPAWP